MTQSQHDAIGHRIATIRKMHDITQARLAELCNVTQVAVSQWERGQRLPRRSTQFLIADALRTSRSMLFRELCEEEVA